MSCHSLLVIMSLRFSILDIYRLIAHDHPSSLLLFEHGSLESCTFRVLAVDILVPLLVIDLVSLL
jgi:hypothetical protein